MTPHPGKPADVEQATGGQEDRSRNTAAARPRNLLQIRFTPSTGGGWWAKRAIMWAPGFPANASFSVTNVVVAAFANFKIEFTIWIELLTDLAALCFSPYCCSTQRQINRGYPALRMEIVAYFLGATIWYFLGIVIKLRYILIYIFFWTSTSTILFLTKCNILVDLNKFYIFPPVSPPKKGSQQPD